MNLTVQPVARIAGELRPPSDKSLTHRAYMFGAIADGPSRIFNPLRGEDCESTLRILTQLGLRYERQGEVGLVLTPVPEWVQPDSELDCGNSGTTMRLIAGLLASRRLETVLTGDPSLSRRPMKRIADPLRAMGAAIEGDTPPLRISGRGDLMGIDYTSPVASAQIKSCILLAGLRCISEVRVAEPHPSRDHTERMLRACGVDIRFGVQTTLDELNDPETENIEGTKMPVVMLKGGQTPSGFEFSVPGDISSAAFFMVAAAIVKTGRVELLDVNVNPTRTGIIDVFNQCGIPCILDNERTELGEPVADILVACPFESRRPFEIGGSLVPRLIDEIPVLAVLATQCEGTSVIRDAKELRVKESDRIELVADGLRRMGANLETFEDGMAITGPTKLTGTTIDPRLDHRIAMAFAVAGLIAEGETVIEGAEAIHTSFPSFESELRRLTAHG